QRALGRDAFKALVEAKTRRFASARPAHRPCKRAEGGADQLHLAPFFRPVLPPRPLGGGIEQPRVRRRASIGLDRRRVEFIACHSWCSCRGSANYPRRLLPRHHGDSAAISLDRTTWTTRWPPPHARRRGRSSRLPWFCDRPRPAGP